jgi:hypothetical protein
MKFKSIHAAMVQESSGSYNSKVTKRDGLFHPQLRFLTGLANNSFYNTPVF